MRPLYDEFDEFAFDDSAAVSRILREQRKEERRIASRKPYSPDEDSYLDEMDDFGDFDDDYSDYNEDEFDTYSGLNQDH